MTRWGKAVSPDNVLPEYPRPQMTRAAWLNLNGLWDYAVTNKDRGCPRSYQGKILVPFPIESALSGVHKGIDGNNRLWYRRSFEVPKEWAGQRVLLHFGARGLGSDRDAERQARRRRIAAVTTRSRCDMTDALTPTGPQELVVAVLDATGGSQPKGKQVDQQPGSPGHAGLHGRVGHLADGLDRAGGQGQHRAAAHYARRGPRRGAAHRERAAARPTATRSRPSSSAGGSEVARVDGPPGQRAGPADP